MRRFTALVAMFSDCACTTGLEFVALPDEDPVAWPSPSPSAASVSDPVPREGRSSRSTGVTQHLPTDPEMPELEAAGGERTPRAVDPPVRRA
jgi:hypothetical protein